MNRRSFFRALAGVAVAPVVAPLVKAIAAKRAGLMKFHPAPRASLEMAQMIERMMQDIKAVTGIPNVAYTWKAPLKIGSTISVRMPVRFCA